MLLNITITNISLPILACVNTTKNLYKYFFIVQHENIEKKSAIMHFNK